MLVNCRDHSKGLTRGRLLTAERRLGGRDTHSARWPSPSGGPGTAAGCRHAAARTLPECQAAARVESSRCPARRTASAASRAPLLLEAHTVHFLMDLILLSAMSVSPHLCRPFCPPFSSPSSRLTASPPIMCHLPKCLGTSLVVQWLRIHLPMQGHGFDPRSGKIPYASEQLSPCATTTEP